MGAGEQTITVIQQRRSVVIAVAQIVYAEVFNRTVTLHLTDEKIECYGKLSELERKLPSVFFRCHRSYLVNLRYVRRFTGNELVLRGGERIPVARNRRKSLKDAVESRFHR